MYDPHTTDFSLAALQKSYQNPHPLYNALRNWQPFYFDPASASWIVTSHAPILHILNDTRFSSSPKNTAISRTVTASPIHQVISQQMLFMDGDPHRELQQALQRQLTQNTKRLETDIRTMIQTIFAQLPARKEIDIVNDFAAPVSLMGIARVLGLPLTDTRQLQQLERWSDTFADITSGYLHGNLQDILSLKDYFDRVLSEKEKLSADGLLGALIELKDSFDPSLLISNSVMILSAGRVTTKKLLSNGIPLLLHHLNQLSPDIQQNPHMIKLLGEELLRLVTPTRYLARWANEDVDFSAAFLNGPVIRQGQKILLFLEAGNYDPAIFAHPAQCDPQRRPNRHLAFGYGRHRCLGAALARVEIQAALEVFLQLAPSRLKPNSALPPVWNPNPNLGGFNSYHLVVE